MNQQEIKTEYLTLLQKPFLTETELKRGRQLVGMWRKEKFKTKIL